MLFAFCLKLFEFAQYAAERSTSRKAVPLAPISYFCGHSTAEYGILKRAIIAGKCGRLLRKRSHCVPLDRFCCLAPAFHRSYLPGQITDESLFRGTDG
jgi:hypothetical protein